MMLQEDALNLSGNSWFSWHSVKYSSKEAQSCLALVTHTYNPNYSGGRNQEDHSSKPAWVNSS
jgi:hypothetical protein